MDEAQNMQGEAPAARSSAAPRERVSAGEAGAAPAARTGSAAIIRPAREEDASALATMHITTWQHAYVGIVPQAHLQNLMGDFQRRRQRFVDGITGGAAQLAVVEHERQIIGFVTFGPSRDADAVAGRSAEVWGLYVAHGHWRAGHGRRLMAWALQRLLAAGYQSAVLWVLEANLAARRFYEAQGFAPDGMRKQITIAGALLEELRYGRALDGVGG